MSNLYHRFLYLAVAFLLFKTNAICDVYFSLAPISYTKRYKDSNIFEAKNRWPAIGGMQGFGMLGRRWGAGGGIEGDFYTPLLRENVRVIPHANGDIRALTFTGGFSLVWGDTSGQNNYCISYLCPALTVYLNRPYVVKQENGILYISDEQGRTYGGVNLGIKTHFLKYFYLDYEFYSARPVANMLTLSVPFASSSYPPTDIRRFTEKRPPEKWCFSVGCGLDPGARSIFVGVRLR
ncbi:MAG: hypothetical protein AB1393_12235 [Candidatus Edwardsbacteria bacterium]